MEVITSTTASRRSSSDPLRLQLLCREGNEKGSRSRREIFPLGAALASLQQGESYAATVVHSVGSGTG